MCENAVQQKKRQRQNEKQRKAMVENSLEIIYLLYIHIMITVLFPEMCGFINILYFMFTWA